MYGLLFKATINPDTVNIRFYWTFLNSYSIIPNFSKVLKLFFYYTVESRYLEVHGTVAKIRVIRNPT